MWYDFDGVLILKFSVPPAFTLIDVAKPWIVESPAPLTCQSLGGSPANVFSQAITLTTGGPHGPAAGAGRALIKKSKLRNTASTTPMTKRGARDARTKNPVTDIPGAPHNRCGQFLYARRGRDTWWMAESRLRNGHVRASSQSKRPDDRVQG